MAELEALRKLVADEKVEAYCFPGGVVQHLLREIGAGRPGLFTHSGLGTFVDPRHGGGRCNARSRFGGQGAPERIVRGLQSCDVAL